VRIVNVARGGVIDEDALVRALDNGIVAQVRTISFASQVRPDVVCQYNVGDSVVVSTTSS
jgi:hypothetical protein